MFNRKNLVVFVVLLAMCLVLAACGHAVPSGIIEIDPETGAGTASFTMVVPKNGAPDVGNNFIEPNGDDGPNNTAYIKNPEALLDLVKANVPEGFEVTMEETTKMVEVEDEFGDVDTIDQGSFDYTITFSFNGVDDYNAKMKQWLPQQYWDAAETVLTFKVKEATLADGALTVDMHILDVISQWAFTLTSTDTTGTVVDGGSGFDYAYYYNLAKSTLTVKLGANETTERYDVVEMNVTAGAAAVEPQPTEPQVTEPQVTEPQATEPQATQPQVTEPQATQPQATQPQPVQPDDAAPANNTGLIIGIVLVAAVAVAGVIVFLRKRGK